MTHASILANIDAAPPELQPALRLLVRDVAQALDLFGIRCETAGVAPPTAISHCSHSVMMALALVERDLRADFSSLQPFRPEAFAQLAGTAAINLLDDETIVPALRRVN